MRRCVLIRDNGVTVGSIALELGIGTEERLRQGLAKLEPTFAGERITGFEMVETRAAYETVETDFEIVDEVSS